MHSQENPIEQKRIVRTTIPGPHSLELEKHREANCAQALKPGLPAYIVSGDGAILVDADDNQLIDFASGIGVTNVGNRNPQVNKAIKEAADHFTHTCFLNVPYQGFVDVCEKLNAIAPGASEKHSALFSTGAEAIENAIKIARNYTGKNRVVVFDRAFHGRTNLTMSMTAKHKPYKAGFGRLAGDVYRIAGSYPLRDQLSGEEAAEKSIRHIEQNIGTEDLACIVIEPIQGEGGFVVPAPGFLPTLQKWCKDNDVLFILDEIQAGIARTGQWFASNHEELEPDLITIAKGVGGGMPLSAVTGTKEVMDAPGPGSLGGTYAGNPIACAAALATLSYIEDHQLLERATAIEGIIREELEPLLEADMVAEIRGRGAMIALEFSTASGAPDPERTAAIAAHCRSQGVIALTCGMDGNVIRLLPPLVIEEDLLRDGLNVLRDGITKTFSN
ncbi:4-aminobutyrate--2-oxoglutarate transaminase [Corynebacterium poyangense]|uniref:(S)-3-amino-2-methylpropionate transaminase n=1 Tax=Corynebacterium poyangense TaxID=2684405 RepID=A0A7H0SMK3_9CORY|nr:4-aminobutyrate--2-oxoglutarate transaminase [Corynebacterium poyangense]QNQ89778.1 4-aminobutyrate--2-oxoglutarate transaminase [Corynebacterium poyangense]